MASSFGQYTGGIQPVQGISEAGARVGAFAQQGMAAFGQSLSEGIKTYNENVAKDQVLQEEAKGLGLQIQQYAQMFAGSPEHAQFTASLQPYIEQLAKVPSMSLTQKMGAITSAKAAFNQIGSSLQAFEIARKERLGQTVGEGDYLYGGKDTITAPAQFEAGQAPFRTNLSIDQNIANFAGVIDNANKVAGYNIDRAQAIEKYKANVAEQINKGVDAQGKPIDPRMLAILQDQLAKSEQDTSGENGSTDYSKESDAYDAQTTSAADAYSKKQESASTARPIDSGVPQSKADKFVSKNNSEIQKMLDEKKYLEESIAKRDAGNVFKSKGLVGSIVDAIGSVGEKASDTMVNSAFKDAAAIEVKRSGIDPDSPAGQGLVYAKAYQGTKKLVGISIDSRLAYVNEAIAKIKGSNETIAQNFKTAETPVTSKTQAQADKKQEVPNATLANSKPMQVGTYTREVDKSLAQKKSEVAQYVIRKYGFLPSGFEEQFASMNPESKIKTMDTPYGPMMYDGKEWKQLKMAEPKSAKEVGESAAFVFGKQDANGNTIPERFYGSDISLGGIFKGSQAELKEFRENYKNMVIGEKSAKRLVEINNMVGESMPWNASVQGEAKALLQDLKAANRKDIIGPGSVSEYEQKLIEDAIGDPTGFWNWEPATRAKLMVALERLQSGIRNYPTIYGLTVTKASDNASREAELRQRIQGR